MTPISPTANAPSPLEAVVFKILDGHVNRCVGALASGDEEIAAGKRRKLLDALHGVRSYSMGDSRVVRAVSGRRS
jgi:hypothetical protein